MKPRITIISLGVRDLPRAIRFYRDGLGFPTDAKDDASIAFFMTTGVRLALYSRKALAEDISDNDTGATLTGFRPTALRLSFNPRSGCDTGATARGALRRTPSTEFQSALRL